MSCPLYRELSDVPKRAIQCDGHDEELESLYEEVKQLKLALSAECGNANKGISRSNIYYQGKHDKNSRNSRSAQKLSCGLLKLTG